MRLQINNKRSPQMLFSQQKNKRNKLDICNIIIYKIKLNKIILTQFNLQIEKILRINNQVQNQEILQKAIKNKNNKFNQIR